METALRNSVRNTIHWLNAAFSLHGQGIEAAIHPVGTQEVAPCFGITVGNQWVIGADGTLTVFDSPEAAWRFLKLLGFNCANWRSNGGSPSAPQHCGQQLYRLRRHRLQSGSRPAAR